MFKCIWSQNTWLDFDSVVHYLSDGVTPGSAPVSAAFQKGSTTASMSWQQYFLSFFQEKEGTLSKYDFQLKCESISAK